MSCSGLVISVSSFYFKRKPYVTFPQRNFYNFPAGTTSGGSKVGRKAFIRLDLQADDSGQRTTDSGLMMKESRQDSE
jgi:hypothetical protein